MSKKILVEINLLTRLLDALFSAKTSGDEDKLDKVFAKSNNPDLQRAYLVWKKDSDKMVNTAREMLKKAGKDTSVLDNLAKKYQNF